MTSGNDKNVFTAVVPNSCRGKRFDLVALSLLQDAGVLSAERSITRSKVEQWIREGHAQLDAKMFTRPGAKLKGGEEFRMKIPESERIELLPDSSVPFDIIFEDGDIAVVNKPPGVVVHPGSGAKQGTLVQGLLAKLRPTGGSADRPGIVHRLDKDTSGLLVIAKNERSYELLQKQFLPPRTVKRKYVALTLRAPSRNIVRGDDGFDSIILPIGRHAKSRTKMSVVSGGKPAKTLVHVKQELRYGVLLELQLETGRTHQIRVHLEATGAGILGDRVYGPPEGMIPRQIKVAVRELQRQALHAQSLSLIHPTSEKEMTFTAAIPEDMAKLLRAMEGTSLPRSDEV